MAHVIISHEVKNFEDWKKGFEAGEPFRAEHGIKTHGIYTAHDNPNHVTLHTEFPNHGSVQGFLSNPQLEADMQNAGVIGKPEVRILNKK